MTLAAYNRAAWIQGEIRRVSELLYWLEKGKKTGTVAHLVESVIKTPAITSALQCGDGICDALSGRIAELETEFESL